MVENAKKTDKIYYISPQVFMNNMENSQDKRVIIVATDESMKDLHDVPRGDPEWIWDNPTEAALEFVSENPEFVIEQPEWVFNESKLTENITHWLGAYLKRTI